MLVSQKLAIAAHLHVLLRRKTGRVTDTEWLANNLEYALEIVRFSRQKAKEDGHTELAEWAEKLEAAVKEPTATTAKPLAQSAMQMLRERTAVPPAAPVIPPSTGGFGHPVDIDTGFSESTLGELKAPRPAIPRYVGGIR